MSFCSEQLYNGATTTTHFAVVLGVIFLVPTLKFGRESAGSEALDIFSLELGLC
jgi:hypothetical protein